METRVPIQHFFDGFRTSHEVNKAHHESALNPRHPHMQGQSQGPDIFFQACEASNPAYDSLIDCFERKAALVEEKTGHRFALYGYDGHPQAENIIVVMGSGAVTCSETAAYLMDKGEKVGVLKVRLFRPWCPQRFLAAMPASVKRVCVLDRTKELGSQGEPLLTEVAATFHLMARHEIIVVGGRYGLGSKEFTPNMVVACYDNLKQIMCAVRQSAIVLPKDTLNPVIMAGMGTGLAPWRAVTQDRIAQKRAGQAVGPCMLFFGARYAKYEYLYREEFEEYIWGCADYAHCLLSRPSSKDPRAAQNRRGWCNYCPDDVARKWTLLR